MKLFVHVMVISDDGWSWVLAWLQIGMESVSCFPSGDKADKQLCEIESLPVFENKINRFNATEKEPTNKVIIVCLHLSSSELLEDEIVRGLLLLDRTSEERRIVFLSSTPLQSHVRKTTKGFLWQTLRHRTLGGLTNARFDVGWTGLGESVTPGQQKQPRRPLGTFLEPAARSAQWRALDNKASDCWRPDGEDALPYPWPWRDAPEWVETYSVFFGAHIQRRFTEKERCQLMDLRHDWQALLPLIWEWNDGCSPPLRFMVEFIAATRNALRAKTNEKIGKEQMENELRNKKDWGQVRAPWLGQGNDPIPLQGERIKYFGWTWETNDLANISVACKGDDAGVNLKLWAVGGDAPRFEEARGHIRNFLWRIWLRNICREGLTWLRNNNDAVNRKAMAECLERCIYSDWWSWEHGSRLFFWRWPPNWFLEARDGGIGFHFKRPRPKLNFPKVPIKEEWIIKKDKEKLEKLLRRGYIIDGPCITTVPRFPVPKGSDDIRVVWDLAKNGVNETMYTPTFFLATMPTYLRRIEPGFYGGDFDIGEQFHNYILHESEQKYCGVEVPQELQNSLALEGVPVSKYMRWSRLVFGWQSSPYMALRMFARALELAKGHPHDEQSAFSWTAVILNLPGSSEYNPGLPRIRKVDSESITVPDIVSFYDDGRVYGPTEHRAHLAMRQITSRIQHLGNQDASRKRRLVSQRPGAWAGGIVFSDQGILRSFVSPVKWNKAKAFLDWVRASIHSPSGTLERARFRSGKGFLVYMSTCYDFIQPYLKGFHLSEDAWRANRNEEGWKINSPEFEYDSITIEHDDEMDELLLAGIEENPHGQNPENIKHHDAPNWIRPVPRLKEDVRILQLFFKSDSPVQVIARPVEGATFVAYGGGDASGEGFGGQLQPLGMKAMIRRGFWCPSNSDESSNWRELRNLIDTISEAAKRGQLVGREVWLATDNSTAANAYYKGTSTSKLLHEMVTELRLLTIEGNFALRVYHVAGTRMIESGIDGLSRGELHVSSLENAIRILMPLDTSPVTRSPLLLDWLTSWVEGAFTVCKPEDWFYSAHQSGEYQIPQKSHTWVWDLPPAAAIHAIEELGVARLRRHDVLRGVVLIPNLLTHEWFRRFTRVVDFFITIAPGSIPEWPNNMYESLTIDIALGTGNACRFWYHSVSRCRRCTKLVTQRQGIFCANFGGHVPGLPACQNAWCPTCYKALPGENFLVFHAKDDDGQDLCVPGEELDYLHARAGDHLLCPFECDYCTFFRIKGRTQDEDEPTDISLLTYIRRANLDAFWSRRPSTVRGLNNIFAEQIAVGERFGFVMFDPPGPFGRRYESGMKAAIGILSRSQRPGLHEETMKFSSVRKARTLHTDLYNASARATVEALVWRSERARFVSTKAPTDTAWFNAFMSGYRARVGERRKQDVAISIELMLAIQASLEQDWEEATNAGDKDRLCVIAEHGAYYLFLYCGSLRGFEGPKVKLGDLRRQIAAPGSEQAILHGAHIGLPLTGRFKARSQHVQDVLIPIAYETASKLQPGVWAERIIQILGEKNITTGWLFHDKDKNQQKMSYFDDDFYERLYRIQNERPNLFTEGIHIQEDYHLARSFRRGATTRATAAGVSSSDIDYINRWNIGADAVGGPMRVLYTEKTQLTTTFLRFSLSL